jgi:UDP-4-amino-4,6-dideoxy-N-acetyl-beta-L-altrosamine transaminase
VTPWFQYSKCGDSQISSQVLPYGRQTIDEDDIAAVVDVLRSDYLTTGPAVDAFEASLSQRMNNATVVSCSSGTAALHLAALALGLGPGDWAIVPAITFLATANAIRYTGADVIFCDVDPETGLMTREILQQTLNKNKDKRIRAVFPVHLAGQPADPIGISAIAQREGIAVIEDACHALGTSYPDDKGNEIIPVGACAHADMSIFSFHPVKIIACGEGGAIATKDPQLAKRLRSFRSHGMTRIGEEFQNTDMAFDEIGAANPWYYEMDEPGYNYRLSDINAALGVSQLFKLEKFVAARQALVARYDLLIKELAPYARPLARVPGCSVGWHLYLVLIDFAVIGVTRSEIMAVLRNNGIGSQVHYIPVPSQPYYRKLYGKQEFSGAEKYYSQTLSLPLYPAMSGDDPACVVAALRRGLVN